MLDCAKSTLSGNKPSAYFIIKNQYTKDLEQEYLLKSIWYQEKIEIKDLSVIDIKSNI